MTEPRGVTGWVGWVAFAGVLMIFEGTFQAVIGLAAIFEDDFWVQGSERMLVLDTTAWGWVQLILGILIAIAGFSAFAGRFFGRLVGVMLATGVALANLTYIDLRPFWSITAITLSVLVIYALIVHGDEARA